MRFLWSSWSKCWFWQSVSKIRTHRVHLQRKDVHNWSAKSCRCHCSSNQALSLLTGGQGLASIRCPKAFQTSFADLSQYLCIGLASLPSCNQADLPTPTIHRFLTIVRHLGTTKVQFFISLYPRYQAPCEISKSSWCAWLTLGAALIPALLPALDSWHHCLRARIQPKIRLHVML